MAAPPQESWMREALALAAEASAAGEVPVGAVVVHAGRIVGRGRDRKIELHDPTAHAEILALRQAAATLGDWRLEACTLVVTLEPCAMCAGAALLARTHTIVYGARNDKFGAVDTHVHLLDYPRWNHHVEVIGGVLEPECAALLTEFFSRKRRQGSGG